MSINQEKEKGKESRVDDLSQLDTARATASSNEPMHTPSPWEYFGDGLELWHQDGSGGLAAAVYKQRGDQHTPVAWVHPYGYLGDPTADAHLIAAAPDLLAALKDVDLVMDDYDPDWREDADPEFCGEHWCAMVHRVKAAIRRAEGKE